MSSYWGTCTGTALLLSETEANDFIINYLRKTYKPDATDDDVTKFYDKTDVTLTDINLLTSIRFKDTMKTLKTLEDTISTDEAILRTLPENSIFHIEFYDSDEYSGGLFYPINKECVNIDKDSLIVWCNKSTLPSNILSGNSYKSIDEIVLEFKDKLMHYLPKDFDWESHIGFIQYAIYA